jgi:hypothetical protein
MAVDFEIHDPKLCAHDKATGKVVGIVALPRNATAAPMTHAEGPTVHRRRHRRRQSACGTYRVVPALTRGLRPESLESDSNSKI